MFPKFSCFSTCNVLVPKTPGNSVKLYYSPAVPALAISILLPPSTKLLHFIMRFVVRVVKIFRHNLGGSGTGTECTADKLPSCLNTSLAINFAGNAVVSFSSSYRSHKFCLHIIFAISRWFQNAHHKHCCCNLLTRSAVHVLIFLPCTINVLC